MSTKTPLISKGTFDAFCDYLAKNMGLSISKDKQKELELKITAIIHAFGGDKDPEGCLIRIVESPTTEGIISKLAKVLSVGETYFFRDSSFFALMKEQVLPQIIKKKQTSKKINIWCTACATGEEPYSIAILIHRLLPNITDWDITILGTDINKHFLQDAEQGIYKKWSFRTTPADIQAAYFEKVNNNHWILKPEIRKMVTFQYANLIDNSETGENFDLIVCHNVLIYFTPEQIAHVIHYLANRLAEDALLSVTAIEVPYVNDPLLTPCYFNNIVLFKKFDSLISSLPPPVLYAPPLLPQQEPISLIEIAPLPLQNELQTYPEQEAPATQKNEEDSIYLDLKELYDSHRYPQTIEKAEPLLNYCKGDRLLLHRHLRETHLLIMAYANQKQLDKALYWCQKYIDSSPLDPSIYCIQATILQEFKHIDTAIEALKKALFLDPNLVIAHFELGCLLLLKKRMKEAQKYLRNALTLLEEYTPDACLPNTDGILARNLKDIILNKKITS